MPVVEPAPVYLSSWCRIVPSDKEPGRWCVEHLKPAGWILRLLGAPPSLWYPASYYYGDASFEDKEAANKQALYDIQHCRRK